MIELRYDYIGLKERGTRPTMEEVVTMIEEYGGKFEGIKGIQIDYKRATVVMKEPKFMKMVGNRQRKVNINDKYLLYFSKMSDTTEELGENSRKIQTQRVNSRRKKRRYCSKK